jgi:hypothetical protein
MAKRKVGRPRKTVETFAEFAASEKRKVGRPKKVETVESKPRLARYEVKTTNHDGFKDAESIEADNFVIAPTGELLAYRSGELIAAFREWLSIVKQEEKAAAELHPTTDSTYASMHPILGSHLILTPGSPTFESSPGVDTVSTGTSEGFTSVTVGFSGAENAQSAGTSSQMLGTVNGMNLTDMNGLDLTQKADSAE